MTKLQKFSTLSRKKVDIYCGTEIRAVGWDLALQSAGAVTKGGFAYHRVSKTEFRWKKLMKQNIKRKLNMKTLVLTPFFDIC